MRVLFVTDRLSVHGGADNHLRQVMESIASTGAQLTLAVGRIDSTAPPPPKATIVRIRCLTTLVSSSTDLEELEDHVTQSDVVHIQNVMNPIALKVATAHEHAIVTVQDHRFFCPGSGKTLPDRKQCLMNMSDTNCSACLDDEDYRAATIELTSQRQQALGNASLVVLSDYMKQELIRARLQPPAIIPPWIIVGDEPCEVGTGIVLGGRLVQHKDVLTASKAWHLAGTTHPLLVAGIGPLSESLEGAHILGWLPPQDLRRTLRSARALVFPSFWQEPFGILGLEALAEGTPVIAAETGGMSEWSKIGCLSVAPGDHSAMAAAIQQLVSDPDMALALGKAGRQMIRGRFSRELIEPRLLRLYEKVAKSTT
ncbi:MAG: glycosyltransferase family 4 protein [bacterium]|nr:glycosyltransferase family 4 protein [bacterium]